MLEAAKGLAAIVQPDAMPKVRPGKGISLQYVMQEFYKFIGAPPHLLHLCGLFDGVEIVTHMVNATAGGRDDVIEAGEIAHEQSLGVGALGVESTVCHGLPAARLIARIHD